MTGPALVRLPGPFDDSGGRGRAVSPVPATPTCCCCCCLVTVATSSTITAVLIHHEAKVHAAPVPRRRLLTVGAALLHVVGWLPFVVTQALPDALWGIGPFLTLATWIVWIRLLGGWAGADGRAAWWRGVKIAIPTAVAFVLEGLTFGLLLVGQVLAIPVPIIVGFWLRRRLLRQGQP